MAFRVSFVLAYAVFILNLGTVLHIDGANALEKALFLISSIIFVITRKKDYKILYMLLTILIISLILAIFTNYPDFSWVIFGNALNQIFVIFALLAGLPTKKDRDVLIFWMSILPVGCAVLGVLYQAVGLNSAFSIEFATGLSRFGGSLIPSFMSGFAMCGMFASLQISLNGRRYFSIFVMINLFILLLAGGRATLAVAVLCCASAVMFRPGIKITTKMMIALGGLGSSGLLLAVFWDRLATRFISSGDNGRDIMWQYLYELSAQYPWTGIGFGHAFFSVPRSIEILVGSSAAHNDFLRILVELGYLGVVAFYVLLSFSVLRILFRKRARGDITMLFAYAGFLFLSRTDNALATPPYFPLVFLAYLASLKFPENAKPKLVYANLGAEVPA